MNFANSVNSVRDPFSAKNLTIAILAGGLARACVHSRSGFPRPLLRSPGGRFWIGNSSCLRRRAHLGHRENVHPRLRGGRLKSAISRWRCSTVEAMQPSSSRAGMTTESSVSGRLGLVFRWVGHSKQKRRRPFSIAAFLLKGCRLSAFCRRRWRCRRVPLRCEGVGCIWRRGRCGRGSRS